LFNINTERMKVRTLLTSLAIVSLISTVALPDAGAQSLYAGWVDRSDELPGMISDGEMLLIAGGAVVVIGGLIAFIVIKKKQDKKLEASLPDLRVFSESVYLRADHERAGSLEALCNEINKTARDANVLFFTRLDKIPSANHTSSGAVTLGVRVNF